MKINISTCIIIAAVLIISLPVFGQSGGTIILDTTSMLRSYFAFSTVVVLDAGKPKKVGVETNTKLPPADWNSADFDDSGWLKMPVPFATWSKLNLGFMGPNGDSIAMSVLCVRGKFNAEPLKVNKLNLSLGYRGGVVVYVNGKEVARGNMPKDGKIEMDTPAEIYPKEVYFNEKGTLYDSRSGNLENLEARLRTLENISIPASVLRKGVNVLAIEVHRSALSKDVFDKVMAVKDERQIMSNFFSGIGLVSMQLTTASSGVTPNAARPSKTQIWNSQPMANDYDTDWGDPTEPLKPIQLVGARNGSFSGKVVIGSTSSIKKVKAVITDLSGKNGGSIPAAAIQIRYGTAPLGADANKPASLDNLSEVPPREVPVRNAKPATFIPMGSVDPVAGAVLPVWITINVPAETKTDDYEGELKITADNSSFNVPVRIRVYNYLLPKPKDYTVFAELIQSPETLALVYKVPLWSEKHWKLIEKSLSFLGAMGTKTCYIPLICKTNMGNEESMVRWIKDKDKYKYDFTVMDKYLDLVEKYQGKVSIVCFFVWDVYVNEGDYELAGGYAKDGKGTIANEGKCPKVTALNNGRAEEINLPKISDPKSAGLWKPLVDELKTRMKKRGLDKSIMVGIVTDFAPEDKIVKFWGELLPDAKWVKHAHNRGAYSVKGGDNIPLGFTGTVWDASTLIHGLCKNDKSGRGWKNKDLSTFFARDIRNTDPVGTFRMMSEICSFGDQRGFARQGADFWAISDGATVGSTGVIASDGRYPSSSWRNLNIRTSLLACGPDGAISTIRYEMMREGVQESEARIAVEKALDDSKLRADHAKRAQNILAERNSTIFGGFYDNRVGFVGKKGGWAAYYWAASPVRSGPYYYLISEWQERSADIYEAAADATAKDKNPAFSVSYRDLTKSASKEKFDKEIKIGAFTVKIEPNPFIPADNKLAIKFQTEKLTMVTAAIYNDKKELVKKLATGEAHSKWEWNLVWDGNDDNGVMQKEGKYTAKINIGGKEGTVTVGIEKKAEAKKEE